MTRSQESSSLYPKKRSPHDRWYHSKKWRRRSRTFLKHNPWCVICLKEGEHQVATICDHVQPHNGDEVAFWCGEVQALCKLHHDGSKQREECLGYSTKIGLDGWPVDPQHPANTSERPVPARRRQSSVVDVPSKLIW
jgi:5-methylcytosine-specific restriction enzyme A